MSQNKEKKSKKALGLAALAVGALVAVGATAGVTLAKYITSGDKVGQATVAKWGYTVTADASQLFGDKYDTNGVIAKTQDDAVVVSATSGTNVVAPGTHGELTLSISGQSEVNAILTIDLTQFEEIVLTKTTKVTNTSSNAEVSTTTENYYPMIWKLNDTALNTNVAEEGLTKADLAEAIIDEFEKLDNGLEAEQADGLVTVKIPANTDMGTFSLKLEWKWDFDASGAGTYDEQDTLLGQYIANGSIPTVTTTDTAAQTKTEISYTATTTVKLAFKAQVVQTMENFNA